MLHRVTVDQVVGLDRLCLPQAPDTLDELCEGEQARRTYEAARSDGITPPFVPLYDLRCFVVVRGLVGATAPCRGGGLQLAQHGLCAGFEKRGVSLHRRELPAQRKHARRKGCRPGVQTRRDAAAPGPL